MFQELSSHVARLSAMENYKLYPLLLLTDDIISGKRMLRKEKKKKEKNYKEQLSSHVKDCEVEVSFGQDSISHWDM